MRYRAFLSYSRNADPRVAVGLEEALERFAKPWNRLRAIRVFRDDGDLSANSTLWGSIAAALDEAEFFILLASRAAAESKWVEREVEYWRARRGVSRLLLVVTDGELVWDEAADDFDWARTRVLPEGLRGAFDEEPRWIDMRWAREHERLTLDDDRFGGAVADLAATLHGRAKDEMVGEQVRQHRRTMRLARAAVAVLSAVTVAAIVAAVVAVWQRQVAADQRDAARSRELAARASVELGVDPAASVRLAAEAAETKPVAEAQEALRAALAETELGAFAVLRGDRGGVRRAAFDSSGTRIVTAADDGTTRILDARTGAELAVLRGPRALAKAVAFDRAGRHVVVASDDGLSGTVRVWDVAKRSVVRIRRHRSGIFDASVDRDGRRVVTRKPAGGAEVWDWTTSTVRALGRAPILVAHAAIAASGDRVFTAELRGRRSLIWDGKTGRRVVLLRGRWKPHANGYFGRAEFDPAGARVVVAGVEGAAIWDAATGHRLRVLQKTRVSGAEFDHTGTRVVIAGGDGVARVADAASGDTLAALRGAEGEFSVAMFDPRGTRVLTAAQDGTARLWHAATGELLAVLRGHDAQILDAVFDPGGERLVTVSADGTARLWDTAIHERAAVLPGGGVSSVAFDATGTRFVTGSAGGTLRIWDVGRWRRVAQLQGGRNPRVAGTLNRGGTRIATVGADGVLRVYDAVSRRRLLVLGSGAGTDTCFAADDRRIVSLAPGGTALVWDAESGEQRGAFDRVLAVDPRAKRIVTVGEQSTARVFDLATGEQLAILRGHSESTTSPYAVGITDAAFDPDGNRVVTVGLDGTARVWEAATGKRVAVLRAHGNIVYSAVFDPSGARILTIGQEGTARVWDAATGNTVAAFDAAGSIGTFDAEGELVATTDKHGDARIWDAATGRLLAILGTDVDARIEALAFEPDGRLVATVDEAGVARIYTCRSCGGTRDLLAEAAAYRRGGRVPISLGGDVAAERQPFLDRVRTTIAEQLGVTPSEVTEPASIREDLGADDLDLLELTMLLEDEFGIRISDTELAAIRTVGQAVDFVVTHV